MQAQMRRSSRIKAQLPAGLKDVKRRRADTQDSLSNGDGNNDLLPIMSLPLELLHEVCGYLDPGSLLQLSRVANDFRARLTGSERAESLWNAALKRVKGLPPCPAGLHVVQYVKLMFSNECLECCRDLEHNPDKRLYCFLNVWTQLCSKCSKEKFKSQEEIPGRPPQFLFLSDLIPSTDQAVVKSDRIRHECKFQGHLAQRALKMTLYSTYKWTRYHVETAVALHEEHKSRKHLRANGEWYDSTWMEEKWAERKAINDHVALCEKYFARVRADEIAAKKAIQQQRELTIKQRLIDQGYEPEFEYLGSQNDFHTHPLVHVGEPLSDQDWDEDVQPKLVSWITNIRNERLCYERYRLILDRIIAWIQPIYTAFVLSRPPKTDLPGLYGVITHIEGFRTAIEDATEDAQLSADTFGGLDAVLQKFNDFACDWKAQKDDELLKLVHASKVYEGKNVPENVFQLATAMFRCNNCSSTVFYPSVLVHRCNLLPVNPKPKIVIKVKQNDARLPYAEERNPGELSRSQAAAPEDGSDICGAMSLIQARVYRLPPAEQFHFHDEGYLHTQAIMELLELDPETTIYTEMVEKNPHVVCLCKCYQDPRRPRRRIMRWTRAMQNSFTYSDNHWHDHAYAEVHRKKDLAVISIEKRYRLTKDYDDSIFCVWCGKQSLYPERFKYHAIEVHKLAKKDAKKYKASAVHDTHWKAEHIIDGVL